MKISIITVCYNSKDTIEDTLKSIINQSIFDKVEYIIIDGNSSDNTLEIISKYRKYIDHLISEDDEGLYHAMNKGINLATGDIIGFLNSDDVFYDDTILETIYNSFKKRNELNGIYGNLVYVKNNNLFTIIRIWKSRQYFSHYFENAHVPPHPTLYLKKEIYKKYSGFNLAFKFAADYEFMLRIFKNEEIKTLYINKIFIRMRLGGLTSKNFINRFKQNIEIYNAWRINSLQPPFLFFPKRLLRKIVQFNFIQKYFNK
jgi:glycosyltransferase involved in cell wall biosynthesis